MLRVDGRSARIGQMHNGNVAFPLIPFGLTFTLDLLATLAGCAQVPGPALRVQMPFSGHRGRVRALFCQRGCLLAVCLSCPEVKLCTVSVNNGKYVSRNPTF
jgi:hypothetical protein